MIMEELLANPAVQAAAVPFIAALVIGLLLKPVGWYWAGLGVIAGFYASVSLITGFEFTPLTSTRKLVLIGMCAAAVGLALDYLAPKPRQLYPLLAVLGGGAVLWVIWPPLLRMAGAALWMHGVGSIVYVVWILLAFEGLRNRALRAAAALMSLGLGTGIAALTGASALLGQLGSALAAGTGAFLLLGIFKKTLPVGLLMLLPAALLSGLIGVSAMTYAKLPWHSLLALAVIPLLARIPLPQKLPLWGQAAALVTLTLPAAAGAIYLVWQEAGAPPM